MNEYRKYKINLSFFKPQLSSKLGTSSTSTHSKIVFLMVFFWPRHQTECMQNVSHNMTVYCIHIFIFKFFSHFPLFPNNNVCKAKYKIEIHKMLYNCSGMVLCFMSVSPNINSLSCHTIPPSAALYLASYHRVFG